MLVYSTREAILKTFRRLLKRTPFYGAYKAAGHYPDYWYWILRGRPERSPHLLKQKEVREYGERYSLKTLVETGTYYGEMVAAQKRRFERIYSIEFAPELAERAKKKFAGEPHIKIFCGDSRAILPEVLAELSAPALFWLDDAPGLTGRNRIPSVGEIKLHIEGKFPNRQVRVEYDILRVTPRT